MNLAQKFACTPFARYMNSMAGRLTRIIVGIVLVMWGLGRLGQGDGFILIIVGLVPIVAGAWDLCLISLLLGGPISGRKIRSINSRP